MPYDGLNNKRNRLDEKYYINALLGTKYGTDLLLIDVIDFRLFPISDLTALVGNHTNINVDLLAPQQVSGIERLSIIDRFYQARC